MTDPTRETLRDRDIPVMPDLPYPKEKETKRLYSHMEQLVRRIAVRALAGRHDILVAVYCAGLYHGSALASNLETKDE